MAINVTVYSNSNSASKTISFDFVGEVMVPSNWLNTPDPCNQYYFKVTTSARQDNNAVYPLKIVRSLGATPANVASLALNGVKRSSQYPDCATAYNTISELITDYVYDYVVGHTADQYSSGCTAQAPMKFS